AKLTFPERWNTRDTRDWDYEDEIVFNPVKENKANSSEKTDRLLDIYRLESLYY
ncbi:hypothetical protein SAMN02583745_01838, partial [Thorsellia anophelis DSM 18579]